MMWVLLCVYVYAIHLKEAPLTLAATQLHPRELIITLVNGGSHIDFRAGDSHSALHRAASHGVYEAIKVSIGFLCKRILHYFYAFKYNYRIIFLEWTVAAN